MDELDRSSKLGAGAVAVGLAALAGVLFAKKAMSAKAQTSIHGSWGEDQSDLDRYPELSELPPEEREIAIAEMQATRLRTGQRLLENAMQQGHNSRMTTARNI